MDALSRFPFSDQPEVTVGKRIGVLKYHTTCGRQETTTFTSLVHASNNQIRTGRFFLMCATPVTSNSSVKEKVVLAGKISP
jgi:hypothetical protein